ncbi:MAG: hypothetical protein EOM23_11835, partial [Candidatus Moranbacteria bacterium]|nr:hypothetical protein [Candidatus Moranbacteria bacterium]
NMPFRMICRKLGADLIYNEFIQAEAFPKLNHKIMQKLDFSEIERPITFQVYGGDKGLLIDACKIIESDYKPDYIDLNFGCWKPKICKRFAGAGALLNPDYMIEIIEKCVEAVAIPITVKTRIGWDENSIIINALAPRIESAGAKALALHCRTREQKMKGKADWSIFNKVKEQISIPLFLNGDIFTPEDAKNALETTKADGLMIGRAAMDDPFIFKYIKDYLDSCGVRSNTGIKYYKITGNKVDLGKKEYYDIDEAMEAAKEHGTDFAQKKASQIAHLYDIFDGVQPLIVAPFDAELYGHWWFEGPAFIEHFFRALQQMDGIEPITPPDFIENKLKSVQIDTPG